MTRYAGGYQDYLAQRGERRTSEADAVAPVPSQPPTGAPKNKSKSGLTYAEKLELEGIMDRIDAAEKEVAQIEALLGDPALYAQRGHEVGGLQARLAAAKSHAATLVERWETLEAKRTR